MITLKGMTWDHERGFSPLVMASEQFSKKYPGVNIIWDRRSLKDFGDYPLDLLASKYDLLLIDHPHIGISAAQGILAPLDEWLSVDYLMDQWKNSVGPSYSSYQWGGRQWALAVDAAAQVASCRPDLMVGREMPSTWVEVRGLAEELTGNQKIGWPLCPTDAMCSFLSLCANIGGKSFFDEEEGIPQPTGEAALALMFWLLPHLHEVSLASNPIQMYDLMAAGDEIVYIPLAFGYSNYSRAASHGHRLQFADIPSMTRKPEHALLGGVGIAVSAKSDHIPLAAEFAEYVASPEIQSSIYYEAGGQPGHSAAWMDEKINKDSNDFFFSTRETLEFSYMRPRNQVFPAYQEEAGVILHRALSRAYKDRTQYVPETLEEMNQLYRHLKKNNQENP